ncbi:MAG: hypothetical protein L3J59_02165 [Methylococcaceae bacterium]|nr:hypothetical protein [Methylococcaceae bacterium]
MIQRIKDCSLGMEWIESLPNLVPTNNLSTSIAVTKYILSIWRTKMSIQVKIKMGKIDGSCLASYTLSHRDNIIRAAYGLGS